jgi:hypothetical protein
MGASDVRERLVADMLFGAGVITISTITYAPATWYLGMSTSTPNDDGTGFTEPVGAGYARVAITNNATNFPPATTVGGVTTKRNGTKFTFPTPTGLWGLLGHYGLFTVSTGGTPDFFNQLDTPITVQSGNTPVEFDVGLLAIPVD